MPAATPGSVPGSVPGGPAPRLLLAAGGAGWESPLLRVLTQPGTPVSLARRCVDVPDLVAAGAAGLGALAAVATDLPGLDTDVVVRLAEAGIRVLAVADSGAASLRAERLGVDMVLEASAVAVDPAVLVSAALALAAGAGPRPDGATRVRPAPADPDDGAAPGHGALVACWGPTGAPGRSTVALGVAAAAAAAGTETLLVDADVYGGASAQMLAVLDEVSGVLAAARAASTGTLDRDALDRAARQVLPRLRVLTGLPRADRWPGLRPKALEVLLARARQAARLVVVDCSFCLEQDEELSFDTAAPQRNGATLSALKAADLVLAVGSADPLGLARLARARVDLREQVPAARVRLVVNRVRGGLGWSADDVRRTLLSAVGEVPLGYLPLDQAAVDACWVRGATLTECVPQAPLTRAVGELAAQVCSELGLGAREASAAVRRRRRIRS